MYFVKYGDEYLHDPRINELTLLDLSLDGEENSCGFCDFTIYPNHPLYDKIEALNSSKPIKVYDDTYLLFSGFIYELGKEFYLDGHVKCKGDLAYLNSSVIRPHTDTPKDVSGYFKWLINNHNSQVDSGRKFKIGTVQNKNVVIESKNTKYTTTFEEIVSKLIDDEKVKGNISVTYEGNERYVNYYFDHYNNDTQVIDFGVNLTSYACTDEFEDIITCVVPTGATENENDNEKILNISSLPDRTIESDFVKSGDMIYSASAVAKYGYIVGTYSNTEIESADDLLNDAILYLKEVIKPKKTIEIKAIDMHLLNPGIKPIKVGEYVRVRSEPHNLNDYFLCTSIHLDLNNPENSEYAFGKLPSTFTSSYNKTVKDTAKELADNSSYQDSGNAGDSGNQEEVRRIDVTRQNGQINNIAFVYDSGTNSYNCAYNDNGLISSFGNMNISWTDSTT